MDARIRKVYVPQYLPQKSGLHCIELGNVELKVGFIEMLTFA